MNKCFPTFLLLCLETICYRCNEKKLLKILQIQSKTPGALGALKKDTLTRQSHFPVNLKKTDVYALFQNYCFFLNYFRSLGPRISTHGNFMMFLVFLVLFWSLFLELSMFRKYYVAMLVSVFLLCPFFVKIESYCVNMLPPWF